MALSKFEASGIELIRSALTDTRLTGVVGGYLEYKKEADTISEFMLISAEEGSILLYDCLYNPGRDEIESKQAEAFGGLGGDLVDVDFKDCFVSFFFSEADASSDRSFEKVRKKSPVLRYFSKKSVSFDFDINKLKPRHKLSSREIANYFICRYFASDYIYETLVSENFDFPEWPHELTAAVLQITLNSIPAQGSEVGYDFFAIVSGNEHMTASGSIFIEDETVLEFEIRDVIEINEDLVENMLKRDEVISVYHLPNTAFEQAFCMENRDLSHYLYPSGRLYFKYKRGNMHYDSMNYYPDADIAASLYVTDQNQLVCCTTNDEAGMQFTERLENRYGDDLIKLNEYLFDDRVFHQFLKSGKMDFLDWLD